MSEAQVEQSPRRWYGALFILIITWVVFLFLLWMILVVEPVIIPLWFFVPAFALTLLFGVGLAASRRWAFVWRLTFTPTVPTPPWIWIGVGTTILAVAIATILHPISIENVLWIGLLSTAGCYALVIASRRRWPERVTAWPSWLGLVILGSLAMVVSLGILIETNTFLTLVFFVALLLFAFHVWFILPLTLYHARHEDTTAHLDHYPTVSVLIPAFNEAGVIGDCIDSVLASTYPSERLEVVVIDDGSTDSTYREAAMYREHGVSVYHRSNGGKHAALNMALECSESDIVATVDADSRPEPTAIERMVAQLEADENIGALSAVVLAQNDESFIAGLQRIEYAVSNTNRRAYSVFDAVPVVPGCLGVYRRAALEEVWGYDPDTVTEDFDLTVKLLKHGWSVRHGRGVVWTIVPDRWSELSTQRLRWYQGGFETLRKHKDALVRPRYDYLHALSLPARFVSHVFGPVMSFIILIAVVWWLLTNPSVYLVSLIVLFFALTGLITLYTIVLENEPIEELVYAPLLFVGYKHFVDSTIGLGNVRAYLGNDRW